MIDTLLTNILPVFAMLAVGFGMGRLGIVSGDEARAVNRVSFLVLQPALIFPLIATADLSRFDWTALGLYIGGQAILFVVGLSLARLVFGRDFREAWLLGMATMFVNHLLYVWPIASLIFGPDATLPITAIVIWDSSVTFGFFIVSMEAMAERGGAAALRRIVVNPVLAAILVGACVNIAKLDLSVPLTNALAFAGPAAAPMTLFALGVILSATVLRPTAPLVTMAALKLAAFPALVFSATALLAPDSGWTRLTTLAAAGPSGAMPFALALLYGVRTDVIAPLIVWTSVLSLFSLAWIAQ